MSPSKAGGRETGTRKDLGAMCLEMRLGSQNHFSGMREKMVHNIPLSSLWNNQQSHYNLFKKNESWTVVNVIKTSFIWE